MRIDQADDTYEPELPPVEDAGFLLDYFWGVGPTSGGSVLSHAELRAWQRNSGVELEPWQVEFLRRLSSDYLSELNRAIRSDREPPWKLVVDPLAAANALKRSIRKLVTL